MDQQELEQRKKTAQLTKSVENGEKMFNLSSSPYWGFFREWLEESQKRIEGEARNPIHRSHPDRYVDAIRAMERADVYRTILEDVDKLIRMGQKAKEKLDVEAERTQ